MAEDKLRAVDVPQADDLTSIRQVLSAVADGCSNCKTVAAHTGVSHRHCAYRLHAARILGLVEFVRTEEARPTEHPREDGSFDAEAPLHGESSWKLTARGHALLELAVSSKQEKAYWQLAVSESPVLQRIAPELLAKRQPSASRLSQRIQSLTGLSPATAERRVGALLAWRRALIGRQLELF